MTTKMRPWQRSIRMLEEEKYTGVFYNPQEEIWSIWVRGVLVAHSYSQGVANAILKEELKDG